MRWLKVVLGALLASCGPDVAPQDCHGAEDFDVTISADYGPLPADTVLRLHYGGGASDDPEELVLAAPGTPRALFCYVSDKDGVYPMGADALGVEVAGGAGAGGAPSEPSKPIEGLFCKLWTDGSADLDVVNQLYGTTSVKLQTKKRVCTVKTKVELELDDAGVKSSSK